MRNRPRPGLKRSNDGGVALKVPVLKLPIIEMSTQADIIFSFHISN